MCAFSRQLALAFRVLVPEDLLPGLLKVGSDRFCSYFIKISWNHHGLMLPRMFYVACVCAWVWTSKGSDPFLETKTTEAKTLFL